MIVPPYTKNSATAIRRHSPTSLTQEAIHLFTKCENISLLSFMKGCAACGGLNRGLKPLNKCLLYNIRPYLHPHKPKSDKYKSNLIQRLYTLLRLSMTEMRTKISSFKIIYKIRWLPTLTRYAFYQKNSTILKKNWLRCKLNYVHLHLPPN